MPSRKELSKLMRDAGVDTTYRKIAKEKGVVDSYKKCVKSAGDKITIDKTCLKREGAVLKAYEEAWTD